MPALKLSGAKSSPLEGSSASAFGVAVEEDDEVARGVVDRVAERVGVDDGLRARPSSRTTTSISMLEALLRAPASSFSRALAFGPVKIALPLASTVRTSL